VSRRRHRRTTCKCPKPTRNRCFSQRSAGNISRLTGFVNRSRERERKGVVFRDHLSRRTICRPYWARFAMACNLDRDHRCDRRRGALVHLYRRRVRRWWQRWLLTTGKAAAPRGKRPAGSRAYASRSTPVPLRRLASRLASLAQSASDIVILPHDCRAPSPAASTRLPRRFSG